MVTDPLGVKADFYRDLALQDWGPLMRRTDVRQAIAIGIMGLLLLVAGSVTVVIMRDLTAIAVGIFCVGYSYSVLWPLRARWNAWRVVGDVTLEMADLNIVPGDRSRCAVRIVPRRDAEIQEIALLFEYRESRSVGGPTAWQVDVAVIDPRLHAGVERLFVAEILLPLGVPPSRFDTSWTRQWTVSASVQLRDGSRWERDFPVLVYPTP